MFRREASFPGCSLSRTATKSASVSPGHRLGKCEIIEKVGQGGMGEVYLARHLDLHKQVAVKLLPPDFSDRRQIDRFLQEARLAAQIEHPNVITIHDVGSERGLHFIVMRYVDGRTLSQVIRLNGGP